MVALWRNLWRPVLAWGVCMVHKHMYAASLGSDAMFIHITRHCDDVWQLLIVLRELPHVAISLPLG
jgi:hypothetical protein